MKTELELVLLILYQQLNKIKTKDISTKLNNIHIKLWRHQYQYYDLNLCILNSKNDSFRLYFETTLSIPSNNSLGWHDTSPDDGPNNHWVNIDYIACHIGKLQIYDQVLLSLQTFIIQWV